METTRTAPAPSRQTCPISSLVRKPAPSSSTTAAGCARLIIPGVFQLKASKGVRDEPWARKSKSKKSFIRTLLSKPKAAVGVDFQPQKRSGSSVVTRTTWTATVRVRPWQAVTGCHRLSQAVTAVTAVTGCHTLSHDITSVTGQAVQKRLQQGLLRAECVLKGCPLRSSSSHRYATITAINPFIRCNRL